MTTVVLLCAGAKGASFVDDFAARWPVRLVASYHTAGEQRDSFGAIKSLCTAKHIPLLEKQRPSLGDLEPFTVLFAVGWQFFLPPNDPRIVILHDALLPKLRGFAPTATALLLGLPRLGVTAFQPVAEVDAGPVLGQSAIRIAYPVKLAQAFEQLRPCYLDASGQVMGMAGIGPLCGQPQNEAEATYAIWRDTEDLRISWSDDAARIRRFVDALGFPYRGAVTSYGGEDIIIDDAEEIADRNFAIRQPGKIWAITGNHPEVVCGRGLLRVLAARRSDGSPVEFRHLRRRLAP
jgi:methionyl-tRNA formyltransferase